MYSISIKQYFNLCYLVGPLISIIFKNKNIACLIAVVLLTFGRFIVDHENINLKVI